MSTATASPGGDTPRQTHASPAGVVADSQLPEPLGQRVLEVTGKLRLWKRERIDVAHELVSHFAEGLANGQTPEDLLANFGDPTHTARLISRAKRRQRPLWWKLTRGFGFTLVALCTFYAGLAIRYASGRPTIAVDYFAQLNATTLATPVEERAWPRYRDAIMLLPELPTSADGTYLIELGHVEPGTPDWDIAAKYAQENAHIIAQVRAASKLPISGYVLSTTTDFNPSLRPGRTPVTNPTITRRSLSGLDGQPKGLHDIEIALINVMMPHLSVYREIARLLTFDARLAASQGDASRAVANLQAVSALARHAGDPSGMLIGQLVGNAINGLNAYALSQVIANWPGVLSDADLRTISQSFSQWRANPAGHDDSINLEGERAMMYDLLQRLDTDDGHGDGRLVNIEAMRLVEVINRTSESTRIPFLSYLPLLSGPIASQVLASRAEMQRAYDDALASAAQIAKLPLPEQRAAWAQAMQRMDDPAWRDRHLLAWVLLPALGRMNLIFAMATSQRDAAVAGIALERYRLAHGTYPATLAELVPVYLPSIPLDPWDGKPIKYLPPDASRPTPILYSVGENQIDNLGDDTLVPAPPSPGRRPNEQMYNDRILWPLS
jgi:hypothetical protein